MTKKPFRTPRKGFFHERQKAKAGPEGYESASGRGREERLAAAETAAIMLHPAGCFGRGVPGSSRRTGPPDRLCFFGPRRLFGTPFSLPCRACRVRQRGKDPVEEPARGLPALLGIPRRRMRPEQRGRKQRDDEHGKSLNEHGKGHADQRQRKSCADPGRKDAPRAAQTFFQRRGKSHHRALRCARAC